MEATLSETFARATAPDHDRRPMPRALMVFAHPDDETIALGARLARFAGAHLVHVTDGVPPNGVDCRTHGFANLSEYRRARWLELERALGLAGISGIRREKLDIPDQETSFHLTGLTRRIAELLRDDGADVVFTHPYEGGHPDHDACAFAVHHAVALIRNRREPVPLIVEATFYHAGPHGIETGTFLPPRIPVEGITYTLSPEEQERKRELLACFVSQKETLRVFRVDEERFRIAPRYEFRRPPHLGPVFYDNYSWGVTSKAFAELAWKADDRLDEGMKAACC